ncbi:XRE family transcriptional regulator [Micromonospora fluostatini]|uniref:XRE family transcriptional regulator n=2 Tax=Micromonospora TaxID=1873 RepID=A0ABY2DK07_9ACTN|nr:XRE family transcriptional regulator [Micromonospora fluostatini]
MKGWGLRRLAQAAHCDPGHLSRIERGLRHPSATLAKALDTALRAQGHLEALARKGDEEMRRRSLLVGVSTMTAALLTPVPAAGDALAALDAVLVDPLDESPAGVPALRASLQAGRREFRAVRYQELAQRLPSLVRAGEAVRHQARQSETAVADDLLAGAYGLAAELSIKLHEEGLAWTMADRAVRAARSSGHPRTVASAQRVLAIALRRSGHRTQAQHAVITAAHRLRDDTDLTHPRDASQYASLLATAAYTAAQTDRRDDAWAYVTEAQDALTRAGGPSGFTLNDLTLYRVGIARALGDYGQAVDHVRQVRIDALGGVERRVRFWEDAALSLMGRGRPDEAWAALQNARATAPQEVLYRPWARRLTADLLDSRVRLPGLPEFAAQVGVTH